MCSNKRNNSYPLFLISPKTKSLALSILYIVIQRNIHRYHNILTLFNFKLLIQASLEIKIYTMYVKFIRYQIYNFVDDFEEIISFCVFDWGKSLSRIMLMKKVNTLKIMSFILNAIKSYIDNIDFKKKVLNWNIK